MIYILKNGEQKGPFEEEVLLACIETGVFSGTDLAWKEGLPEWVPLSELAATCLAGFKKKLIVPPPLPKTTSDGATTGTSSEFYAVGEHWGILALAGAGKVAGRNLFIMDRNTNQTRCAYVETDKKFGIFAAKKIFSPGAHSSFNTDVILDEKRFGNVAGRFNYIYSKDGQLLNKLKTRTILTSGTLFRKYLILVIALMLCAIYLVFEMVYLINHRETVLLNQPVYTGAWFAWLAIAAWLNSKKIYVVRNAKRETVFEIRPQKFLWFSVRSFNIFKDGKMIGEIGRLIDGDQVNELLNRSSDLFGLGNESKSLVLKYRKTEASSMTLIGKMAFAAKVASAVKKDTKSHMASTKLAKTTTLRPIRISGHLSREDQLALFTFTYFAYVSNDCDDI